MIIVGMVGALLAYALFKRVDIYSSFVEGAKEGLTMVIKIIPFIAGAMLLIGGLNGSGLLLWVEKLLEPLFEWLGLPQGVLPFMLIRPISGAGSMAVLTDIIKTRGVDSKAAVLAASLMGSSETVMYTIAIYLGATKVKKSGYCIFSSLLAMALGLVATMFGIELMGL